MVLSPDHPEPGASKGAQSTPGTDGDIFGVEDWIYFKLSQRDSAVINDAKLSA